MFIKNHYLLKFIKLNDPYIRMEAQNKYRKYRNLLSALLKRNKQFYFTIFLQEIIKDLKKNGRE